MKHVWAVFFFISICSLFKLCALCGAGWFARDPTILRQVGHILLQLPYMDVRQPRRFLIADDCFKLSLIPNEHTVGAIIRSIQKLLGRMCPFLTFTIFMVSLFFHGGIPDHLFILGNIYHKPVLILELYSSGLTSWTSTHVFSMRFSCLTHLLLF